MNTANTDETCEICGAGEHRDVEVHPNTRVGHENDFLCDECEAELTADEAVAA